MVVNLDATFATFVVRRLCAKSKQVSIVSSIEIISEVYSPILKLIDFMSTSNLLAPT